MRTQILLIPIVTFYLNHCYCDSTANEPNHVSTLNEPVMESGFKPMDTGREKDGVKKRGLVIDEQITLSQVKREESEQIIESEILASAENTGKVAERVSKDLRDYNRDFMNKCDNCNAFPWVPIARSIRMTPSNVEGVNHPPISPPQNLQSPGPQYNGDNIPAASDKDPAPSPQGANQFPLTLGIQVGTIGSTGNIQNSGPQPIRAPPVIGTNIPNLDQRPIRAPPSIGYIPNPNLQPARPPPGLSGIPNPAAHPIIVPDLQPIRVPFSIGNIPNPEFQYHRHVPIPVGPSQNFLTYSNGGMHFKKEPPMQITLVNRPEKPTTMLETILSFFSPRKPGPKPPHVRPPIKSMPLPLSPTGKKHPESGNEPNPSAGSSQLEYEKPPPFPNPPYIPLNNDFKGPPPSMHLPPNKIFIYNIAADQNAKANQELPIPIINYNPNARKPEVNTIRPVQQFANFRYAPMAIFPQPVIGHLVQPCPNCNQPGGSHPNAPQRYPPGLIAGLGLPPNAASIETIKSKPIAQYLASVEYPHELIQSPLIDVSAQDHKASNETQNYTPGPHEPKLTGGLDLDAKNELSSARPVYSHEPLDNSLAGSQTSTTFPTVDAQPVTEVSPTSTIIPDLKPSAGNIITNLTGSPFRTTTAGYTDVSFIQSQSYADFDWPVTQTSTISGSEETTQTDYPTTYPTEVASLATRKPTQVFNVSYNEQGREKLEERPNDPAFNYLSPPPVSDWSQDYWGLQQPTATPLGFQTTLMPPLLKKKKQIQIIVPYTMMSQQDAEAKTVGTSTENLITAINQLPETNRPTTLAEIPFVTLDHLQQFLDENKKKENGIDLFRLQKNIDNWTAQGFSNHKHGQSEGLGQDDQKVHIHPAKNIPEDFLTGNEAFSNSLVSIWSKGENAQKHSYSERRSVGLGNHQSTEDLHRKSDEVGESQAHDSRPQAKSRVREINAAESPARESNEAASRTRESDMAENQARERNAAKSRVRESNVTKNRARESDVAESQARESDVAESRARESDVTESRARESDVAESRTRESKIMPGDVKLTSPTTSTTTEKSSSKVWDSIPVSFSPLTKERVYMVTAVSLKDDASVLDQGKSLAQTS